MAQPRSLTLDLALAAFALGWVLFQLVYLALPIDLMPDVFPVIGWLDDLVGLGSSVGVAAWAVGRLVQRPALPTSAPGPVFDYEPMSADDVRRW